ncbi:hypothetical protein V1478_018396 [Vespula squamosa]|uniref:Uncharacterized protein n=1 Tax=Vespula squamosa TaxID=30214 RepID=A0ABD1ZVD1_VESSQ
MQYSTIFTDEGTKVGEAKGVEKTAKEPGEEREKNIEIPKLRNKTLELYLSSSERERHLDAGIDFAITSSAGDSGVGTGCVTLPTSKGRSSTRGFPRWFFLGKQERKDIDGYGDLMAYCSRHPMPPPLSPS